MSMSPTAPQHRAATRQVVAGGPLLEGAQHDALLFVSFGGPEAPDEVVPFLQRVTAGRNIPEERLRLVGQHYFDRGGVSPINQLCRDMIDDLTAALSEAGIDLPIYWGNRNSAPFLADTIAAMSEDGVQRALAFVTSAYGSYSGCRQYRENLAQARAEVGPNAPEIEKLRLYFNHPGFVEPLADGVRSALAHRDPSRTQVFFTAHSIPTSMAESCRYVAQLESVVALIIDALGDRAQDLRHALVWQSRSGPPSMPWLEPDIVDAIDALPDDVESVVVVPVGFVSDHMEVLQDLDTDAARAAAGRSMTFDRVATSGTDPRFISMIVDLVRERLEGLVPVTLGPRGLEPEQCSSTCCPAPRRPTGPQRTRPAS